MTESEGIGSSPSIADLEVRRASRVARQQLPGHRSERGPVELRLRLGELLVQALHRGGVDTRAAVDGEVPAVGPAEGQLEGVVVERLADEDAGRLDRIDGQIERPREDVRRAAGE